MGIGKWSGGLLAVALGLVGCRHTREVGDSRAEHERAEQAASSARRERPTQAPADRDRDTPEQRQREEQLADQEGVPEGVTRDPPLPVSPEGLLTDEGVRRIQQALGDRGMLQRPFTGELDARTTAAVKRFQDREGLAATGAPDRETVMQLGLDPEEIFVAGAVDEPRPKEQPLPGFPPTEPRR